MDYEQGVALDIRVAKEVLCLEVEYIDGTFQKQLAHIRDELDTWRWVLMPRYHKHMNDAWRVVDKMNQLGWSVAVYSELAGKQKRCSMDRDGNQITVDVVADSAAEAICRAALKAKEIK